MSFRDGEIEGVRVVKLERHRDERGFLVEVFRADSLTRGLRPEMGYISYTKPGVARGPHEHLKQTDVFAFIGPGNFKIYLWDNRDDSKTYGNRQILFGGNDNPITVVVPPRVVHGYRNVSESDEGMVLNFPDKLYAGWKRREPVDEIRHEEAADHFYNDFVNS
jgi:dTDP-4-dehydrorhamnose 3,5-epimerase